MGNIDWKDKKNIYALSIIVLILAAAYCIYLYVGSFCPRANQP